MAVKYLTSLDLRTNELQYASIHPLTSAPTGLTPQLGQVYFNTMDDKLKIYGSAGWVTVGAVNSISSGTPDTISIGGTPSDPIISALVGGVNAMDNALVLGSTVYGYIQGLDLVYSVGGMGSTFIDIINTNTNADPVLQASLSATGTPDATKYLRGDNTWSPVSGIYSFFISDFYNTSTQIANGDIVEIIGTANEVEVSLSNKTFTVGLPNDVTIANDLTVHGSIIVDGDMTVNGTVTTINTETINLADNVILLNSNLVGAPTTNAGIEINRGTSDNRSLIWDEAQGEWVIEVSTGQYYPIAYVSGPTSYATTIGSSTTSFVNHGLNTTDVFVQLYDTTTGETIIADVLRYDVNSIQVSFNTAPGAGTIRVLVSKIG